MHVGLLTFRKLVLSLSNIIRKWFLKLSYPPAEQLIIIILLFTFDFHSKCQYTFYQDEVEETKF